MLLLIGPTRAGKGVIARVLKALVGRGNYAGPTLASLGTNFGLSPLIGKPLAGLWPNDPQAGEPVARALAGERWLGVLKGTTADGRRFTVQAAIDADRSSEESQEMVGLVCSFVET